MVDGRGEGQGANGEDEEKMEKEICQRRIPKHGWKQENLQEPSERGRAVAN